MFSKLKQFIFLFKFCCFPITLCPVAQQGTGCCFRPG